MVAYLSDLHLGDQRIFDLCRRPFKNLSEMEGEILRRWNEKVGKDDQAYLLGDIADSNHPEALEAIRKLNGHKHLIIGNHDLPLLGKIKESNIFESIGYIESISDGGRAVCLCHYPMLDWMGFNDGSYLVYGHIHNKTPLNGDEYVEIKRYYRNKKAFNCSADVVGFAPKTLEELMILKEENKDEPYIN